MEDTEAMHRHTAVAGFLIALWALAPLVAPTDVDLWWHLRAGQWIAENGVPRTDPFSWTAFGRPWVDHEWAVDGLMYRLDQVFGYPALAALFGLITGATAMLVYALIRRRGASRVTALVLLLFFMVLAGPTCGVRPQIVGTLFAAAFIWCLDRDDRQSARALPWQLGGLMLLWVNTHGSFMLGIGLIGLQLLAAVATRLLYRQEKPPRLRPLVLALIACTAASLVNPYGIKLWLLPFDYLFTGGTNAMRHISEWQSPDFHSPYGLALIATLLPLLALGLPRPTRNTLLPRFPGLPQIQLTDALRLLIFLPMVLQSAYHLSVFAVLTLPAMAASLAQRLPALSRESDGAVSRRDARFNIGALATAAALTLLAVPFLPAAQTARTPQLDGNIPYPHAAADFLESLPPKMRLFNEFNWGGYLIYRLYPQRQVFVDGRIDMYREQIFEDFRKVDGLEKGWRELLEKYAIDTLLTGADSPLDGALAHEAAWHCVYRDKLAVVYRRSGAD